MKTNFHSLTLLPNLGTGCLQLPNLDLGADTLTHMTLGDQKLLKNNLKHTDSRGHNSKTNQYRDN